MTIEKFKITDHNDQFISAHQRRFDALKGDVSQIENVIRLLTEFQIAIPSWALGIGGTRFGRFPGGGEPRNLEEKIEDIGLLHALNKSSGAVSLHIPWDIPKNARTIKILAAQHNIRFDAVNSNTFQDQKDQKHSYKFGSLQHVNKDIRQQAIDHN